MHREAAVAPTLPEPSGLDPASAKAAEAEHHLALVRGLVILFTSVVHVAFLPLQEVTGLAWTVIVVANVYAFYVIVAQPYRRFPAMATTSFTAVTDGLLITTWLAATGGFESPYFPLWYLSLVAVAFRYEAWRTIVAGILYTLAYVALVAALGQIDGNVFELTIRCGYIVLCSMVGARLAHASSLIFVAKSQLESDLERSDRFRLLAEATTEGVVVHKGGTILLVNRALAAILGRRASELIGRSIVEFVHAEDVAVVTARIQDPSTEPIEVRMVRPDGDVVPVVARSTEVPSEGEDVHVAVVQDVRHQQAAEAARREALDREAELKHLRQLDRMRTTFINTAAHELNTPLTPIRLQLHMLRQQDRDPKEQRVLEMLDRNLQRLSRLVQDLLDVSRLQEGRLRLRQEETDLSDTVRHVVETFRYQAEDQGIELAADVEPDLRLVADRQRIEQVLVNLISNALRFTHRGGTVHVAAQRQDDEAILSVRDDGAGMTDVQRAGLFQPFSQQHLEHHIGGLGLGLYIANGLVESHGGTIDIQSPGPNQGTVATVRLPMPLEILA